MGIAVINRQTLNKTSIAPQEELSYSSKLNELVAKILAQLNKISQKDRIQIEKLKTEYKNLSEQTVSSQRNLGSLEFKVALVAMGTSILYISPYQDDQFIAKTLVEQFIPGAGNLYKSAVNADLQKSSSMAQLTLQEYTNKASKGQSDASSKQEFIGILTEAYRSLKEAAQGR